MASKRTLRALKRTLTDRQVGLRTAVLVLGDGLNLQAAEDEGIAKPDSWQQVMRQLWRKIGVTGDLYNHLPRSVPLMWDHLVCEWSYANRVPLHQAYADVQDLLAEKLRRFELKAQAASLYGRLLQAGFRDLISLNVDRRLILHSGREELSQPKNGDHDLFSQHSRVDNGNGGFTRVWYPHGSTHDPSTIRLGREDHGKMLLDLEDRRSGLMRDWMIQVHVETVWNDHGSFGVFEDQLEPPKKFHARWSPNASNWYHLFFIAPLIVIGARLSVDEWPIWWLLHQRARNFVPFSPAQRQKTFYLTVEREDHSDLMGGPGGLELVNFSSYKSLWNFVLS